MENHRDFGLIFASVLNLGLFLASILEQFSGHVQRHPNKRLFGFLDAQGALTESYTYTQFLQRVEDIARHLHRSAPAQPGTRVLLVYPPGVEMIAAFFASVRLGWVPVPVYPPARHNALVAMDRLAYIATDSEATHLLTDRSCYWLMKWAQTRRQLKAFSLKKDVLGRLRWLVTTEARLNGEGSIPDAHSDLLFLQYTSGSTHDPKGVMVTHESVLANCDAAVDHEPVSVSWLPQYHDMGLIGYYLFFAMKGGTTYGFSPLDFLQRPALWLEAMSRYQATSSAAPDFAYGYCLRPDKVPDSVLDTLDLSRVRFLANAAEPVRAENYLGFRDRFARCGLNPEHFFCSYGLAEFTLVVSQYGRSVLRFDAQKLGQGRAVPLAENDDCAEVKRLVSCGPPLPGTSVEIVHVDGDLRACAAGEVGEIWVDGPSKGRGYWNRPQLSAEVFEATLPARPTTRWLRTGDLGFLVDGELFICGRIKDLIIIRGRNYYPQDIEQVAESDAAVRKGCVAAFSVALNGEESLVVVAEVNNRKVLPDVRRLTQTLRLALGLTVSKWIFIERQSIHKTSSGKIRRHQVRMAYESNTLSIVDRVDGDALGEVEPITPNHPLASLFRKYRLTGREDETLIESGLDSVALAAFAQDLEHALKAVGADEVEQAVDLRLLQTIRVVDLFALLTMALESTAQSRVRFRSALMDLEKEHRAFETQMMLEDAELSAEDWAVTVPFDAAASGAILLTGGTGFLGPFLVHNLLCQCASELNVLVRGEDPKTARHRLILGMNQMGLHPSAEQNARLRVVCGDLEQPGLGLAPSEWQRLATEVHTIVHNGAIVNYLYNYDRMRKANVLGTRELVRLAFAHRTKVFNHISTTFVFGWSNEASLSETFTNENLELMDFGYSQTKWVSEQIVQRAMSAGLPGRIFRPALISPTLSGQGANADISIRLLAFMLKYGFGTTAKNQVSFIPVDQVAHNIVAISQWPDGMGQTFHVTRDAYARLADVTEWFATFSGHPIELLELDDFVDAVLVRCTPEDPLFPLLNFFVRSTEKMKAMSFKRYDNAGYQIARTAVGGIPDASLKEVVYGIYQFMTHLGLVQEEDR